ncbi:MAG: SIS domain-containing protein [Pseudomonadota bacterium]
MTEGKITALAYMQRISELLASVVRDELGAIREAGRICAEVIDDDGMIYVFGTGHSHMLAEEGHYRAGGLACVCPILASSLMLHEGAAASTGLERQSGLAEVVFSRYPVGGNDVVIVFSNSGINAVPVEAEAYARMRGARTIAVLSKEYAEARKKPNATTIADNADVAIDNHLPPGDAIVPMPNDLAIGAGSTALGAFILNAIFAEALGQVRDPDAVPIYISGNMKGAKEHNAGLVQRYRARNPHL